ncbi:MAG: transglutaminase-like cysteine peptidase [Devosia sp.]|uniref:transglutaminase-like cysteine peptidase n=1 Tax=Devosia sp. TaxID=1871048 RepID=UPI001AD46C3E|nr:transglutaminase-like cysteine peptidase [Devosia sp.]MBN9308353.1 transglutaminase-like cysteine peptidase [Devosia sp.]MBN9317262.1 transglutaminase-like cysteine peptidase [Devosia sp.]
MKHVAAFALLIALFMTPAIASQDQFADPAYAPEQGPTSTPVGHYEFCKSHAGECGAVAGPSAEVLTEKLWAELQETNNAVNASVAPVTDQDLYRVAEYWTYPNGAGDCEDYVLEKRRELIAKGWPASTLLIAVVRKQDGEGHAILLVRTDRGDLALDNLDGEIHLWNETPYTYLKRQSQTDASRWVGLEDGRVIQVASMH